jgi:replicative DNA helicase
MDALVTPNAPELEQAVLGALLILPAAWIKVGDLLTPELFYVEAHRDIFKAAHGLWMASKPVDTLTVSNVLRGEGLLDQVGGVFYVSQLTGKVAGSAHIEYHVRILIEHHVQRSLIAIGTKASADGYTTPDAFDLLDRISAAITDLYGVTQPTHLLNAANGLELVTDGTPSMGYTFGITELDRIAVFEPGLPHVFAGRPGIGKSIFALEVCWHLTMTGNVLLFSPEMTLRQVQARILSRECGVPYQSILRKRMDAQQSEDVANAAMNLSARMSRLKVDPTGGITPDQIRIRTERAMKTENVIAFAVDHLHKMKTGNSKTDRSDFERISQCMNGLTEVAKNTMLPALVMCQLNREVEKRSDKKPNMADLRGSGEIEQDAAVVGLLFREGYYQPEPPMEDTLEISIAKNRDGAVGLCTAPITPAFSRIGNPTYKPTKAPF